MLRAWWTARTAKNDDRWDLAGRVAELESAHRANYPQPDILLVRRAYRIAEQMHRGQGRKSGEPYITHPIEVATILARLGLDSPTVAAALLHDTVEDTSYTLERLRADFGSEISVMVDGVTKLDKIHLGDAAEAETWRKLLVAAGQDIRVPIIKLADRLHNMRTLKFKSRPSQIRIANATKEVLIPLADRLGLYIIKRELEDLVLQTLEPELYGEITEYLADSSERNRQVSELIPRLRRTLRRFKVNAKLLDRPRHPYSVYREMEKSGSRKPHDPPRVVVVVNGKTTDCYAAMGAIHSLWQPKDSKFRDFVAAKKFNLYQSLHTTVMGPRDAPIDFLIRTDEMHRLAELGIVAQIRSHNGTERLWEQQLPWLRRLLEWQRGVVDSDVFLDSLRSDLADQEMLVFSREGKQVLIPKGSTPIDMAYAGGPEQGHRLVAAYVNGSLVCLTQTLHDGDLVDLVLSNGRAHGPSQEWLLSAKTPAAHLHINEWFDRQHRLRLEESELFGEYDPDLDPFAVDEETPPALLEGWDDIPTRVPEQAKGPLEPSSEGNRQAGTSADTSELPAAPSLAAPPSDNDRGAAPSGENPESHAPHSANDSKQGLSTQPGSAPDSAVWTSKTNRRKSRVSPSSATRRPAFVDIPAPRLEEEKHEGKALLWHEIMARGRGLATERPLAGVAASLGYPDVDALYLAMARLQEDPEKIATQLITTVDRY
ncbi:RelA/SpoT family protein [Natronoglycomyces albus]|uniref:Bifunctional (P)ppGpp synthetase/guanosine-3',5'-bis(Diphosphate) 3'-pyrophosphohydrolase n=1 Tax=Natronoglycomyces albus TaxID=2811108 RepID=A0A895XTE7_9ACTN|nr:HD domain-containing protein [Natronoglycomyces albus]QSB06579.1 bifunctional (p)ppGpp synthetase/guanosine-3',5'-bis(diphosphate) 3'-pyrophosphohydrolase [Natronoglycomyces albus]